MQELRHVSSVDDLRSFEIITYLGNGWAEEHLQGMNVRWLAKQSTVLEMLSNRRGDSTIENALITHAILDRLGLSETVVQVPGVLLTQYAYNLCIGKGSPHVALLGEFDTVIRAMRADGTLDRIVARYRTDRP